MTTNEITNLLMESPSFSIHVSRPGRPGDEYEVADLTAQNGLPIKAVAKVATDLKIPFTARRKAPFCDMLHAAGMDDLRPLEFAADLFDGATKTMPDGTIYTVRRRK